MSIYLKAAQSLHKQGPRYNGYSCVQIDCEVNTGWDRIYTDERKAYADLFQFDGRNIQKGTKNEETLWDMGDTEQWELRIMLLLMAHEVLG